MKHLIAVAVMALGLAPVASADVHRWARTDQCPVVTIGRRRRISATWAKEQAEKGLGS